MKMILKIIGYSAFLAFIIVPVLNAVLIPFVDQSISPKAPKPTGQYNTFKYVWGMMLVYYAPMLLVGLSVVLNFVYYAKSRLTNSWAVRLIIYVFVQLVLIYILRINEDYFRHGSATLKWMTIIVAEGILMAFIPVPKTKEEKTIE